MDWIDKKVSSIQEDERAKQQDASRRNTIASQSSFFWTDLRYLIKGAVEKLNLAREIRRKYGEVTLNDSNVDILKVDKLTFPAVRLTIFMLFASGLRIEREITTNSGGGIAEEHQKFESENLRFVLDNDEVIFLKPPHGKPLRASEAVEYLLTSLLRKESRE